MKLILLPALYYDVTIEDATGKTFSRFFSFTSPLRCRELALTFFLETVLNDEFRSEELFVTVYLRHQNGERVEIISSSKFGFPEECWTGLERELQLYRKERIETSVVVYDSNHPTFITILPQSSKLPMRNSGEVVMALEQEHHLFFKGKQKRKLSA